MLQVLVVDDDADVRNLTRAILEDAGYAVIEAQDDQAALALLRPSPEPLVVLLDIFVPPLTGIQLLEHVATDERLLRHAYVAWSAYWTPVPSYLAALVRWCVPKPFRIDELLDTVAEAAAHLDYAQSA